MAFSRRVQRLPPQFAPELARLQQLCRQYHVRPSKQHSQNFLLDHAVARLMAEASGIGRGDVVLEVGAGFGMLTAALLESGADVLAFEIDQNLAAALLDRFRAAQTLKLVVEDFFRWYREEAGQLRRPFSIVANLPYHASGHFFSTVLSGTVQPRQVVVMLQKEVAERVVAQPGEMSMLGLTVQYYGRPALLRTVSRSSFWPQPDVDSAVLSVADIRQGHEEAEGLFRCARIAFANRRKQLHNSLSTGLHIPPPVVAEVLAKAGIDPRKRPQDLSLEAWKSLVANLPT